MSLLASSIEEVQGLYGPYSFSEKLLQKIWLRGDFDRTSAITADGRRVRVLHPGKWNLLAGPDFLGARLAFEGAAELTGDVELHLRANDWIAHGHAHDPAYGRVMLHVVLFPPKAGEVTRQADGAEIPVLALLPLLHHDLEAFAADDAVELLAQRPASRVVEELGQKSLTELRLFLREHAEERWRLKVHFARQRLDRLSWESACHHAALEILGYRFNRAPMLRLAGKFPLEMWTDSVADSAEARVAESADWSVQGVRPANHPVRRLAQYMKWVRARTDWPARLTAQASEWPPVSLSEPTQTLRRTESFRRWRSGMNEEICGSTLGGTRFDTIICDGWLPLLAAQSGDEGRWAGMWFHWFVGDLPIFLSKALRELAIFSPEQPACNGYAQGLLGWFLKREATALVPLGRGA